MSSPTVGKMKLWLDDKRPMPAGFDIHVVSAFEAIDMIKTGKVTKISLDNDLGDRLIVGEGWMVADFIEEQAYFGNIPKIKCYVHSDNAVAVERMCITLNRAMSYWHDHEIKE